MPVSTSKMDDHDEYSMEYSFALEYSGPPVGYDVPQVVPVDVYRIPTAAVVSKASVLNNLSLPIIQPIVKSDKSLAKRSKFGPEAAEIQGSHRILSRDSAVDANDQEGAAVDGLVNGDACATPRVSDRTGSSDTLGFSDSHNGSNEISESSDIEDLNDENISHAHHANPELEDRSLGSSASSCEIATCEEVEDCLDEASHRGGRTPVVTFRDPQTSEITSEYGSLDEPENAVERPVARSDVKRGLCYRCFKGNRFTEKEACLVCGAKYCRSCLLRAMGSMPEGRKCITCIGHMIDESKRGSLGKASRMLKKLLTGGELKQIMRNENSCEANQLPPNLVSVNGRPLSLQELCTLQNCRYPPKTLKPGRYWYDKQSGFWGKEGQQPCQIISPRLDVGSQVERNASNGNTDVLINGREITKKELWMLELVRIRCEGRPHFWLNPDGTYQEEGQKNVMGKLWDKSRIRFICAALSLPIPPESCDEVEKDADKFCWGDLDQKVVNKLLLVGCDQSGTSTIFKQAKILYSVPFSRDERQNIKFMIQTNLYRYIGILLEGREWFEEVCLLELRRQHLSQPGPSAYAEQIEEKNAYSISPRLKAFSDWLQQVMMSGNLEAIFPAATREYATLVEDLVKDSGFQATYSRRNELPMLPRVANYFLDRAVEISRVDYEPSDMDILYAEGFASSNGVASMEFSFPMSSQDGYMEPTDRSEPVMRYQLIRVHASSLGVNCKWLEMFEDVDLVLFCVSLTDYDEYYVNSDGACVNKMLASKKLIENIVTHPTFAQKDFLLILNKFDLLEEKLERVPLSQCEWFQDFNPVMSSHSHNRHGNNNPSLAQRAFQYIGVKFKRWFGSLTERKLYISPVTGLESDSVDEALKYAREILKWEQEKPTVSVNEWSSESMEASTSS